MNTQLANKITTRTLREAAAAVGLLLIFFTIQNVGQKEVFEARRATSRDGLMDTGYLTKADVSDDLDGTDDEYFYKFTASPGKLTITVEVTANETNAGAVLDLFGANSKAILSNMLVQAANGESERISKSVNIAKKQDVIIRIKGLRSGSSAGYPGTYKIVVEGPAANFKDVEPSDGAGGDEKSDGASTNESGQDKKPGTSPAVEAGKDKKAGSVDRVIDKAKKESGNWIDLVEKVKKIKP